MLVNLWSAWLANAQSFTEVRIDGVVGFAFTFRRLNPVTNAGNLLLLAIVFALELVHALRVVQCKRA